MGSKKGSGIVVAFILLLCAAGLIYFFRGKTSQSLSPIKNEIIVEGPFKTFEEGLAVARSFRDQEKVPEAISAYQALLKLNPESDIVYGELGDLYNNSGEYNQAITIYEKALEKNPNLDWVLGGLGMAYLQLGEKEKAREILEKALVINPNLDWVKDTLSAL